jgi:cation transporter-like permease
VAVIGAHDPLAAVRDALSLLEFDGVFVSMLSARTSAWLHQGLPGQIRALGVPVTEVIGIDSPLTPLPAA